MFIDLLILADPTGAVDMTYDAISRRTNVPLPTVERCIAELCQPDVKSRSQLHEGKRIIPLDSHRDWGWQIVNYAHYRKIRDQEARRSYFRDYQRKRRKKIKSVKDKKVDKGEQVELLPSSSTSSLSVPKPSTRDEVVQYCRELGLPETDGHWLWDKWEGNGFTNNGKAMKSWRATVRQWNRSKHIFPSHRNGSQRSLFQKPRSVFEIEKRLDAARGALDKLKRNQPSDENFKPKWRQQDIPERDRLIALIAELKKELIA